MSDWSPTPMQMTILPPYYAQKADGTVLPDNQRVLHPLAAQILIRAQDELFQASADSWPEDKPIMVFTTMTRDNAFQYRLVKSNRRRKSAMYPNGIPTATVGKSLHAFGLAVDINIRQTIANINAAEIDLDFKAFRQFLAGHGAIGIKSEVWHYNLMLHERYFDKQGWELRELIYGENWKDLDDSQKEKLLRLTGVEGHNLSELAKQFQSRYHESLQVDGVCGTNTTRAAYVEWSHKKFKIIPLPN